MEILPTLIRKEDVINNFSSDKQYSNWIASKLKSNTYIKVRNNLYALIDYSVGDIYSNKFQIASKISNTSFLCYHSALEYYAYANHFFRILTVGSVTRFNNFEFSGYEYEHKLVKNDKFVDYVEERGIRVTSKERTIIDCIDNINRAGGIEEVLEALERIRINENRLIEILKYYNKIILYQKVGYLLEIFNERLKLTDEFFEFCKAHIGKKVNYFLKGEFKETVLNKDWNLIVPKKNIKSRIYEGV